MISIYDIYTLGIETVLTRTRQPLNSTQQPSRIFVFIDPYQPLLTNKFNHSSLDVFIESTKKGMQACLWYGFAGKESRNQLQEQILAQLRENQLLGLNHSNNNNNNTATTDNNKNNDNSDLNQHNLWWGDIYYEEMDRLILNPGVEGGTALTSPSIHQTIFLSIHFYCPFLNQLAFGILTYIHIYIHTGCSILLGNCSQARTAECERLGQELQEIYKDCLLPDGSSGAIVFETVRIA